MEKKKKSNFSKTSIKKNKKTNFNENSYIDRIKKDPWAKSLSFGRWNSCKNLMNFVPKILPKKSFCTPSLFILNPSEEHHRVYSSKHVDKNLYADIDSNDSFSESNEEEKKDKNKKDIKLPVNINKEKKNEEKNNKIDDNMIKANSLNDLNLENKLKSDFNNQNKTINNQVINLYDSDKYLSILDVLLMNHK